MDGYSSHAYSCMMMKLGLAIQQQQQQDLIIDQENMSNLTSASASGEAASPNQQSSFASPTAAKKKRNLPGNPDPDAEVISLSPKTLMATNRFMCEICKKGFQRDQNLQLHRRGHNLPWKLKQRSKDQVGVLLRKKVYICPESTCLHHHPSRALGDLTGIKKHFSRKHHGEKKYKCDKCSKKYAVHSDWKAHSKTCGTREYKCDCGTIFSRRDSFITHRAFCDALAEESAKAVIPNTNPYPHLFPITTSSSSSSQVHHDHNNSTSVLVSKATSEQQFNSTTVVDQARCYSSGLDHQINAADENNHQHPLIPLANFQASSAHMSATALLQKAAQMCATMSGPDQASTGHMAPVHHSTSTVISTGFGQQMSSGATTTTTSGTNSLLSEMMMMMLPSPSLSFNEIENENENERSFMVCSKGGEDHFATRTSRSSNHVINGSYEKGGGGDGLTRDFLGMQRAFSHKDILSLAAAGLSSSFDQQYQQNSNNNNKPWNI